MRLVPSALLALPLVAFACGGGPEAPSAAGAGSSSSTGGGSSAAQAAAKLGKPARLLIGLGSVNQSQLQAAGVPSIDLYDRYLANLSDSGGWQTWNANGSYVDIVAAEADAVGAVPMYTLYQMATWGDGNIWGIENEHFMTLYWDGVRVMFQRLGTYNKPAVINVEPDFWGYVMLRNQNPTQVRALVTLASECADLPDDVTGMGRCIVRIGRRYAPKVLIGFPPSDWGMGAGAVITFMNQVGTAEADLVIMQTLDRDAGCFEARANNCSRDGQFYWDETNATSPNFSEHLAEAQQFHNGLQKPLLWWQTPLGVPSATPGGSPGHYRDSRVHYMFAHPQQFVDVGALGIVFSGGASEQTDITTDGGQFAQARANYMAHPTALP